jgi:hypothetical protein
MVNTKSATDQAECIHQLEIVPTTLRTQGVIAWRAQPNLVTKAWFPTCCDRMKVSVLGS